MFDHMRTPAFTGCSHMVCTPRGTDHRGREISAAFRRSCVPEKQLRLCVECGEGRRSIGKALGLDGVGLH